MFAGLQFKAEHEPDVLAELAPITETLATKAAGITATLTAYSSECVTEGTGAANGVTMPNGEYVGQRKHFKLKTRTHASDTVAFVTTNFMTGGIQGQTPDTGLTVVTLDAANEEFLFEWTGAKWNIVYSTGTVTT